MGSVVLVAAVAMVIASCLAVVDHAGMGDRPPGVVIDQSPDPAHVHVGCPGIAILPDGAYVATHSWFGTGTTRDVMVVFRSADKGFTWRKLCTIKGQWWSSLFVHERALYLMGTSKRNGDVVIRRSDDGGRTWTTPKDRETGLLMTDGAFHCAPVPVVVHKGRLWRACEDRKGPWGSGFRAFMMSAPVGADLLKADNWTATNRIAWGGWKPHAGFLEGNAVVTPDRRIVNILRVHNEKGGTAAVMQVSDDGRTIRFDPKTGFIGFPGGCKKFTIRYDPVSKRYWSLTNYALEKDRARALRVERQRNTLALTSSSDLTDWKVNAIVLWHPDVRRTGFQYVDWQFDGDDLVAAIRTAFKDAPNCHDANYFTFLRVTDFRTRTTADPPP